ncbi:DsrH/TusB family sulfur metabolism protein [Glaciecola sp. 1036]|uniref:DsrH/TusB family sulfur metabolism protein n=1 Tax=Alteromonadaceae TaxID=72275 RepID=UPI003D05A9CE
MIILMSKSDVEQLQPFNQKGNLVVLMMDAIYAIDKLQDFAGDLFVLETDWQASGLPKPSIKNKQVEFIDDQKWVNLCAQHAPVIRL